MQGGVGVSIELCTFIHTTTVYKKVRAEAYFSPKITVQTISMSKVYLHVYETDKKV